MEANLIPVIAAQLGLSPSTLLFYFFVITSACNAIARYIPDTATGWQGTVRKVCSFLGVYVRSRVAPGITVTDVTKASLVAVPQVARKLAEDVGEAPTSEQIKQLLDRELPAPAPSPRGK